MRNQILKPLPLILLVLSMVGCFPNHSDIVPSVNIDPADARALSQVLVLPDGSSRNSSGFPSPSTGSAPIVTATNPEVTSSNGGTIPLVFTYRNVSGSLGGCYVQVIGADAYFKIPIVSQSGSSGTINVPIGIPTNVLRGRFCIKLMIYDATGRVSNIAESCVEVLRLGTGSLQVSLSWANTTDQDLHVTDPDGYEIYYSDKNAPSGGELDRDDVDGFGPENIYWLENAPDGIYKVEVDAYNGSNRRNDFFVTINAPGKTKTYSGFTGTPNAKRLTVATITKSGSSYVFTP
jgi:hypothetical protein